MDEDKSTTVPRDARTIEAILKSMGVEDYDPRVVQQLLEFLYRYVTTILTDSRQFADHADKQQIDVDDIKLAIRSRCSHSFTQPPPRDVTMRLAAERNSIPLPPIDPTAGVALPPKDDQLTAQNHDIVIDPSTHATHASPKRPRMSASPRKSPGTKSPSKSPRHSASPRKTYLSSPAKSSIQQNSTVVTPTRTQPADPDIMIIDPQPAPTTLSKTSPMATSLPAVTAAAPVSSGSATIPIVSLSSSVRGPGMNPTHTSTAGRSTMTPEIVDLDAPPTSSYEESAKLP